MAATFLHRWEMKLNSALHFFLFTSKSCIVPMELPLYHGKTFLVLCFFYKKGPAGQRQRLVKVCVLYEFLNQTKQSCVIASLLSFHATCCIFILFIWSMTGCKKNCVFLSKLKSDGWNILLFALSNTIPRMIFYGSIRSGDFQQHSY